MPILIKEKRGWFYFSISTKSVTLVELIISVTIVSFIILSFYSIDTFSRNQVVNSERRTRVQNDLSYVLDHMGKYVQQANGDNAALSNNAIVLIPGSGFKVRVDLNTPLKTPSNLNDDVWISYSLTGNTLSVSCNVIGTGSCASFTGETLSTKIRNGFVNNDTMPDSLPVNPVAGFYVKIINGSTVYVGLVGHFKPTENMSLSNPQVSMKAKLICNSCSTN